jgi:hypothetical protein
VNKGVKWDRVLHAGRIVGSDRGPHEQHAAACFPPAAIVPYQPIHFLQHYLLGRATTVFSLCMSRKRLSVPRVNSHTGCHLLAPFEALFKPHQRTAKSDSKIRSGLASTSGGRWDGELCRAQNICVTTQLITQNRFQSLIVAVAVGQGIIAGCRLRQGTQNASPGPYLKLRMHVCSLRDAMWLR